MSRQSGSLSLSSNLEPKMAAPLDAREKVADITELTDPNSFSYSWIGMPVYVVSEEKWYCLRYADTTNIDNWVTIGTGKNGRDGRDASIEGTTKEGRENTVTFVWYDPSGSDRYTDLTVLDGAVGPEGPRGPEGPAGADGQSFSITGIYESYEAMIEAHPTGNEGDAYFVQSDEEGNPPDVYVWLSEDNEWNNIGPLQGGRGVQGPVGPQGFSPDITVAETTDSSYKLRVTNQSGSYLTPNLKGNLAPIDTIDPASAVPVQSKTIAAALDTKQPKILATPVAVRDYLTKQLVSQTTVQATLEALAACVNYAEIPVQYLGKYTTAESLPTDNTIKPGSLALVGEDGDETFTPYIYQENKTWQKSGGTGDGNMTEMSSNEIDRIWDASSPDISWISGVALPQDFCNFGACVYDGKIHIFGGHWNYDYGTGSRSKKLNDCKYHYRLNNGSWELVDRLPEQFYCGACVVYHDKVYLIGGNYGYFMYEWDGTSWTKVTTNHAFSNYGRAVVYNDEIHVLGGETTDTDYAHQHYKWDGTEWTEVSTLPCRFNEGAAIVYDDKIHIIGSHAFAWDNPPYHYAWDGTEWIAQSSDEAIKSHDLVPFIYDNKLNVANGYRFEYDDNGHWVRKEKTYLDNGVGTQGVVLNGHVHLMGGDMGVCDSRAHKILQ